MQKRLHSACCVSEHVRSNLHDTWGIWSVVIFWPKYRSTQPENYLFSLSNQMFSGSKYPPKKNFLKKEALHMMSEVLQKTIKWVYSGVWKTYMNVFRKLWKWRRSLHKWLPTVKFFSPKYRSGHPENYLFLLPSKIFLGSKYPTNI